MDKKVGSRTLTIGFAMFSMFFGAGNVVFPLALGQWAEGKTGIAILGLLVTAILVPFTGLLSMATFRGNYHPFLQRIGRVPGMILGVLILSLIGPFGAMPRCIALSYSTLAIYVPTFSQVLFSALSCIVIFICSIKKKFIVDLVGRILTPILIVALLVIIVKGIVDSPGIPESSLTVSKAFFTGLREGYQTMDLLGALFFSGVIVEFVRSHLPEKEKDAFAPMMRLMVKSSLIGALLLGGAYVGFCYVSAAQVESLQGVTQDKVLGRIAQIVLGDYAGVVVCIGVMLTCLTTAIALAAVFSEFIHYDVLKDRVGYSISLLLTLVVTFLISTLEFRGIVKMLAPIIQIAYPGLLVLCVVNVLHKLYDFKPVKVPVYATFAISAIYTLMS